MRLLFLGLCFVAFALHTDAVYCPQLKKVPIISVLPESCFTQPSRYASICQFRCPAGYRVHGQNVAYCKENGEWEGKVPQCIDVQPPDLQCPNRRMVFSTEPGQATANVVLPKPQYSDNSRYVDPSAQLTFTSNVPLKSLMSIGLHQVRYTVKDEAGLESTCSIVVAVEDREPPVFKLCPKDMIIMVESGKQMARVTWDKPIVTDNSGGVERLFSNIPRGSIFHLGSLYVVYSAEDASWNSAECTFTVTVKQKCEDAKIQMPWLSCAIPAADLRKCDKWPLNSFPVVWKQICRKTCRNC